MKTVTILILSIMLYSAEVQSIQPWQFKAEVGIYSSPVIISELIYFGDNGGRLYALNISTGTLVWSKHLAGAIKSKPCAYNDWLIVNDTSGKVSALNSRTGQLMWQFETGSEKLVDMWDYYLSSPVVHKDVVFVGSGDNHIYAINANNGSLKWKYQTGGVVHASPVIRGEKLLVGSFDGYFYALDCNTGAELWRFKTIGDKYFPNGAIQKAACIYKDKVIFGSRDFNIYALDIETGRGHWNYKERGSWIIATSVVIGERIYFGTSDSHRFCSFNAEDGVPIWDNALNMRVYATAVAYYDKVYYGCFNGKLFGVSADSGQVDFEFQTEASRQKYDLLFKTETHLADGIELYGAEMEEVEKRILGLGDFLSDPLIDGYILYVGDANGYFYAIPLIEEAAI